MIAINTNPEQNGDLAAWRAKGKYTFPVVVTDSLTYARTNYAVSGTPTNIVLNSDGKMVFRHMGFYTAAEETLEAEIRELLGLKPFEGLAKPPAEPEKKE